MILLDFYQAFGFAVLSTVAFGILFQAPRRVLLVCGVVGAVGWLVFIYLRHVQGGDSFYANLAASVAVALLSELAARFFKQPVTVFVIPGLFPIVPGLGMYNGMTMIIDKHYDYGVSTLLQAGMDASAIALGVMFVGSFFRVIKLSQERRLRREGKSAE